MNIGLDLSVLQTPHRLRGVGATAINFVNNIPDKEKKYLKFTFFLFEKDKEQALELLELDDLDYEIVYISNRKKVSLKLPRRLQRINGGINGILQLKDLYFGDSRINDIGEATHFIQFNQGQVLPPRSKIKSTLILYDIIPYVMESDYMWGYRTARNKGRSIKNSIRLAFHKWKYKYKLQVTTKKATNLIAISEYTKSDFIQHIGTDPDKISVSLLGINPNNASKSKSDKLTTKKMVETSWGYIPRTTIIKPNNFLLFVGGVDPRRKLVDLLAAFNNLRAEGTDIKLVLAGDTMNGAKNIPNKEVRKYLENCSYLDDVYFLGYISVSDREWLYSKATAFVYPSVYEGFGLPILEAMRYGTPVITYKNSSIKEIADNSALYVNDYHGITEVVKELLSKPDLKTQYSHAGKKQVERFSWTTTTEDIIKTISA